MIQMNIKVYSRIRPLNKRQKDLQSRMCIETKGPITRLFNVEDPEQYRDFIFDGIFQNYTANKSPSTSQQQVFKEVGVQILDNAENGYNCCILAYGQTGTGKTFTIMGSEPQNEGIMPRVCVQLFNRIQKNENKRKKYEVVLSTIQIYNEKIRDMSVKNVNQFCRIRQNKINGVYIDNLNKKRVFSFLELSQELKKNYTNRTIWQTTMSVVSSRSHTIITIQLKQTQQLEAAFQQKFSILHFVDLAGSERIARTGVNDNNRLRQAVNIGKSLSSLGQVISALLDKSKGKEKVHVPYRDSCITRILQNALGGNCKTTLICTLSGAECHYDETLSTLRFADAIRRVENKIFMNQNLTKKQESRGEGEIKNQNEKNENNQKKIQ